MKAWLVLSMMALASCSVPANFAESNYGTGSPMLGIGFGRLVTIEAVPVVDEPGKGPSESVLRVLHINGDRVRDALVIPWTYGGWHAERPEAAGHGGFLVEVGRAFRLRGYETGAWEGVPRDVYPILRDEYGPPQSKGFYFRSVFRVIDGEPLTDPSK